MKDLQAGLTSYDLVPYPGYTHPQTHPHRLAVIAALFGLEPARGSKFRVLEMGCGNGSNLVPMAWGLPGCEFVGIDLAASPIRYGQQMIHDLGLANIRLVCGDIAGIGNDWGQFDYIIAHGLFSWVPAAIREQLLKTCRDRLAPQGIVFVSYLTYPGGHLRNMVREMMLFHVRNLDSSEERVRQAMALVKFLADGHKSQDEYGVWLKAELESVLNHEPGHLYHDELAEISQPLYFTEFIGRATAHGLQYVGEADFFEMFDHGFSDSARQALGQLGRNRILREQYLDFLKCRRFRQTLLCHADKSLHHEPLPAQVATFLVSSSAKSANPASEVLPAAASFYQTPRGARCATDYPLGKAALTVLEKNWPMPIAFGELLEQSLAGLKQAQAGDKNSGAAGEQLCGFLLDLYRAGIVEFRVGMPAVARTVSEHPVASPVARWQVQHGDFVTSQLHTAARIEDEIGRYLLSSLDGSRDRGALVEEIWTLLRARDALVVVEGNEMEARGKVEADLVKNLESLARLGLLVE